MNATTSLTNTVSVTASTALDAFTQGLTSRFEEIKRSAGKADGGRIITKQVIDATSSLQGNMPLSEAGEELIIYLQDTDEIYRQLDYSEWLKATDDLLMVDEWMNERVGWGNLVIKIAICNKIINRVMEYLEAQEDLSSEEYGAMLIVLEKLRWHLPSENAMYFIAYRHHVGEEPFKVESLSYTEQDVRTFQNAQILPLTLMAKHYFRNKSLNEEEAQALFNSWAEKEKKFVFSIADYRDLYLNPIPFLLPLRSYYRKYLWDLYFNVLIRSQSGGSTLTWQTITEKDILPLMKKASLDGGQPWMRKIANDFYIDRSKHARPYYMEYIKEGGGLEVFRKSYQRRLEREAYINRMKQKPVERRRSIIFSSFKVHELP